MPPTIRSQVTGARIGGQLPEMIERIYDENLEPTAPITAQQAELAQ
jgi:hypothetical protein